MRRLCDILSAIALATLLAACGGGSGGTPPVGNVAPVANAGAAQNVASGSAVRLDGSTSTDANSDPLTYAWTLASRPAGSSAALDSASSPKPSFVADIAGPYVVSLTVNDGNASSVAATVTVVAAAANKAPVSNAGVAQSVLVGALVTLDGSASSDSDGNLLTYVWALTTRPPGSAATLGAASSAAPSFTADRAGSYVATLVVNDGQADSAPATVGVTASLTNAAPVANAGAAQSVRTGTLITLSGAASSDANGDTLSFAWTLTARPAGSAAVLAGSTSAAPTFIADLAGSYGATLVVSDGQLSSAPASVNVTASTSNAAPVANAGVAQNVVAGSIVTLDGRASSDADGDPLTYAWTLAAKPAGSGAALVAAATAAPTFTADLAGTYVMALVVNDGKVSSAAAMVSVSASIGNAPPIANAGTAQNAVTGSLVTLNGAGSSDANGDALSYLWTFSSRPNGSTAALAGTTTAAPTFTTDLAGTYVASLVVNDGKVNSGAATVTVTARTPQSGLPVEQLMTTAAFGDVEFDWARDGVYCASCNFGAGNARFNWVDHGNRLWVANIDPDTGAVSPQDGRGVLVDNLAAYYSDYGNGPEWVFSALGSQLVYSRYTSLTTPDDDHVGIGMAKMVGGNWTSGFLDGVLQRNSPAPTQTVGDSVPRMAFAGSTSLNFYWRALSDPPGPEVRTTIKTVGLSVRWLPGTGQFVYTEGVEDLVDGLTYQQVFFYDTAVGTAQQLTFDPTQKRGAFMFSAPEFGGDMVFFTVADRLTLRIYRYQADSTGSRTWKLVNSIVSPDTAAPLHCLSRALHLQRSHLDLPNPEQRQGSQ